MKALFSSLVVLVGIIRHLDACCLPNYLTMDYIWTDLEPKTWKGQDNELSGSIVANFIDQRFYLSRHGQNYTSTYFADLMLGEITWHYTEKDVEQCFKIATKGTLGRSYQCITDDADMTLVGSSGRYGAVYEMRPDPLAMRISVDRRNCLPLQFRVMSTAGELPEGVWFPIFMSPIDYVFEFEKRKMSYSGRGLDFTKLKPPCEAAIFPAPVREIPSLEDLKTMLIPPVTPEPVDYDGMSDADYQDYQQRWWAYFSLKAVGNITVESA